MRAMTLIRMEAAYILNNGYGVGKRYTNAHILAWLNRSACPYECATFPDTDSKCSACAGL